MKTFTSTFCKPGHGIINPMGEWSREGYVNQYLADIDSEDWQGILKVILVIWEGPFYKRTDPLFFLFTFLKINVRTYYGIDKRL